jgi:lysophospholipase L1-like esterase
MYRFQVKASTQSGETIGLVGSIAQLGNWNPQKFIPLTTSSDRYPFWWVDLEFSDVELQEITSKTENNSEDKLEYKYVRILPDGKVNWESDGGDNRWVPLEQEYAIANSPRLIIDDGAFSYIPSYPYGYLEQPPTNTSKLINITPHAANISSHTLKIMVIGSSVAMGCSAWLLNGWANRLGQALKEQYGHQLINRSHLGANVTSTIERFAAVVVPEKPDIVIIALSLGNEGLAYCRPHDRRAVQRRFESGLLQLIQMTKDLGAVPILGGLYPHGDYTPEHNWLLRDTYIRMQTWQVPILDWLDSLDNGYGRWQSHLYLDAAHPNTLGHELMLKAIDLQLFDPANLKNRYSQSYPAPTSDARDRKGSNYTQSNELSIFKDSQGFEVLICPQMQTLRIINRSSDPYVITPTWHLLQSALTQQAKITSGTYLAKNDEFSVLPLLTIANDGTITNVAAIPAGGDLLYCSAFKFFAPKNSQIIYYDGHIGVLKEGDRTIRIINESDETYNIHPMWKEMRTALAAMPAGVYTDQINPDAPFRTMMIGDRGLESRVKAPAKSTMILQYQCALTDISRIAILPLGDRCAARMLLYKMEYDGPAFPFDLARSTNLGDVADMVNNDFADMWNPQYLHYSPSDRRIYHSKWLGLSFGHEVEDHEDPMHDMQPIHERMKTRYSARAKRFLYTIDHADELLFIRTGVTNRGYVLDLMEKLTAKCQGKPFRVLLISQQDSQEFKDIPQLLHYNLHFSPDWMYDSQDYWLECTKTMKEILEGLGVSSRNLFWCPPNSN